MCQDEDVLMHQSRKYYFIRALSNNQGATTNFAGWLCTELSTPLYHAARIVLLLLNTLAGRPSAGFAAAFICG